MPTLFNKLAHDVITALQPKQAAALDLHQQAYNAARDGLRAIGSKHQALLGKAATLMARQKFQMDMDKSWLRFKVWSSDGLYVEGELFFKDIAPTYRSVDEGRKIFEAVLDVDATRVYGTFDEWLIRFGK
jgi:hypothetical protein